jgi:hypothetical protein
MKNSTRNLRQMACAFAFAMGVALAAAVLTVGRCWRGRGCEPSVEFWDAAVSSGLRNLPIGTIVLWRGSPIPEDWQACRGQDVMIDGTDTLYGNFGLKGAGVLKAPEWGRVR